MEHNGKMLTPKALMGLLLSPCQWQPLWSTSWAGTSQPLAF